MFEDQVFAVVDLETTGTKRNDVDRIFQFGCALIKNGEIFKTYSFLINPEKKIPAPVENLTGITNDDVKNSPTFDHYAGKIREILTDTIFVAHNVNFDLPFLNGELMEYGYLPLENYALDTVELAQIAFPTLASYKLQDLSQTLNITHNNPHHADSDAVVTAKLLLKIIDQLSQLPQATLHLLTALSKNLTRDNDYLFEQISLFNRQFKRPLSKDLAQINSLVLKKQLHQFEVGQPETFNFPEKNEDKKALFKNKLTYRENQVRLINALHEFIVQKDDSTSFLIEAPNGTGKTFSYLFSYAYQLSSMQKLVISTPTKVLQTQVLEQEFPQLRRVTGLELIAESVKSSRHYLDLDGFYSTLYHVNQNRPNTILQMRIIVWLTKTSTGDLDELQLTNHNLPIFGLLEHPGDARNGTDFSDYDFWNYARFKQEQADILVTNHAYLSNHAQDLIWGQNPFLVIDEAHRFLDSVINSKAHSLEFESFWGALTHLKSIFNPHENDAVDFFNQDQRLLQMKNNLLPEIGNLIEIINQLQQIFYQTITKFPVTYRENDEIKVPINAQKLIDLLPEIRRKLDALQNQIEQVRNLVNQIIDYLLPRSDSFIESDQLIVDDLTKQIDSLDLYAEDAYLLADALSNEQSLDQKGIIIRVTNKQDPLSTNVNWLTINADQLLSDIYQRFQKKTFISATITDQNSDFSFMSKQLNLDPDQTRFYQMKLDQKWLKNLHVSVLKDKKINFDQNSPTFQKFLPIAISKLSQKKQHNLILFTNLERVNEVYLQIVNNPELADYEILAQGVTGSNEKIAKRFALANKAILLGSNAFFEGIDFKDATVDQVIITQLPFESPENPEVILRQEQLQLNHQNVFLLDILPRAIIRFRQASGRLIRRDNDQGELIVLDQRINSKDYGKLFKESLQVKTINYFTAAEIED